MAAASFIPTTRLIGRSLPLSSSRSIASTSSAVVWNRFAASGSTQRDTSRSTGSGTSGTTVRTGGGGCSSRPCNSSMALWACAARRRPVSMS